MRLSKKCDALLRQAERVKAKLQTPVAANVGMDKQVEAKRKATSRDPFEGLSTREKVILLRGSKLNGFTFPPWQCSPDTAEFAMADGEQRFLYVSKPRQDPSAQYLVMLIPKETLRFWACLSNSWTSLMDGKRQNKYFVQTIPPKVIIVLQWRLGIR